MLLDLFITHWTEPWEVGEKAFKILECQRCVDWNEVRITLVHDGTEPFQEEYFEGMPFKVNQVSIPNGGIAAARNWCIDHSEAKWIKWNDFDDSFACVYALRAILNVLGSDDVDLLWFDLLWEEGDKVRIRRERDPVFVHNKVFRRDFLIDHKIRFQENLTWCEDSAFLAVIEMEIDHKRIGHITNDSMLYLYQVRQGSLCNRPEIKFANLQSFFLRHCYVAEEFLKRGLIEQYNTQCVRVMADSYYTCRKAHINEDRTEHERTVWEWFDKHREPFYRCTPEQFKLVMNAVNNERFDAGEITAWEFLNWINEHERGER